MEDVDPVTQSHQAVFERCRHGIGNAAETGARQSVKNLYRLRSLRLSRNQASTQSKK
jgi:hypothetical protein